MRIEANLTAELDKKPLAIKWKNRKLGKRLRQVRDHFLSESDKIEKQLEDKEITQEEFDEKADNILAEFYHGQCDVMFDFEGGTPDVGWFGREDFPVGQMEFLRQVFTDPQIQT